MYADVETEPRAYAYLCMDSVVDAVEKLRHTDQHRRLHNLEVADYGLRALYACNAGASVDGTMELNGLPVDVCPRQERQAAVLVSVPPVKQRFA